MTYSVLVPVDADGDRALNQARYVARFDDAPGTVEATVLYVYPRGRAPDDEPTAFSRVSAAVRAAEYLEGEGVTTIRRVAEGPISERVLDAADGMDADEVVVGGRKRSGVQKVLLGSTTQDVVLSAEQPVTVTGTDVTVGDRIERLLVPVDRDEDRARHQAAYVAGLPGIEGVDVTVLYVFPHQDYTGAPPHEFEEVDAAVAAADYLAERGVAVDRVAVGGEVARTVVEHADELDADGLVVGGRKRSGLQSVLLGSTTQDVVLSVERPVTITG